MEKETNKKLLPTYAFWRTYTKFAVLEKHTDRPSCEISVTVNIRWRWDTLAYIYGWQTIKFRIRRCCYLLRL